MKTFTQIVNEGNSSLNPFSIFGLLFGSSHDKDDAVSTAKRKAREDMAKKKAQAKEDAKKKKKEIKAKLIEAKANYKINQFNIKQKQKMDALERRLRQATKLASMYDRNSKDGILHSEDEARAFQKVLNNVKNGLPEDHIDDMEFMQAKIAKCLFKKDENGNVIPAKPEEIQTALAEVAKDPAIKEKMEKYGVMNDKGEITIDDDSRRQLLQDFAGYSSDYEHADEDLKAALDQEDKLKIQKETLERAEATREKLNSISSKIEQYTAMGEEPNKITTIPTSEEEGGPKPWDKMSPEEQKSLAECGVTKNMYEEALGGLKDGEKLEDKLNDDDYKTQRTAEFQKSKEALKTQIQTAASEADLTLDADDFGEDGEKLKSKIQEKHGAIDRDLEKAEIPKDTPMETIKTALTDATKRVTACREKIEEKEEQTKQLQATYEAAEEVERRYGIQDNEQVKQIRATVEKESWNGGEVENDGKKGVEYVEDGTKKFMPRPEPGSKDEKLYQQRLKLAILQQQEDLSQPLEVVEPVIDKDGEVTNKDDYTKYLQAKAKREAAESQMEKIRTEIQDAAKAAVTGKEITPEQKELLQTAMDSFPDDYSKMTEDQQAMLASLSMTPPKDPKAKDEVTVGNQKKAWEDLDDKEKETYRQKLREEEETKHKERLKKLGLSDDQIEKAQKLSKKETSTSGESKKETSTSGESKKETLTFDDITADDFEDGEEIKGKKGEKYIKRNGKFWMQDEDGSEIEVEDFDDWLEKVKNNTEFDPSDLEDKEEDIDFDSEADHDEEDKEEDDNEYDDGTGNKLKNPSKIWHRKPKKNGKGKTKSYYNGEKDDKGRPISISRKEFKEKLKAYRDAKQRHNDQQSSTTESLSIYLQKKLLLG